MEVTLVLLRPPKPLAKAGVLELVVGFLSTLPVAPRGLRGRQFFPL